MIFPKAWGRAMPSEGLRNPYYDIQGAHVGGPLTGILLGHQLVKGLAHYVAEASRYLPCTGEEDCYLCVERGKRRKAYCSAVTRHSGQCFVMEFTDYSVSTLAKLTQGRESLRGLIVTLTRAKNKSGQPTKQGKVLLQINGEANLEKLPPYFDEIPHLQKMWGMLSETN
jgi:hypothetical protein